MTPTVTPELPAVPSPAPADESPVIDLTGFFAPRSVALVGASESSGWTRFVLDGVELSPGLAEVNLINPRRSQVHGRPTVPRLADLPAAPDLAFVMVGSDRVSQVVEEALAVGTRDFVVLSAGFEGADGSGTAQQQRLQELCRSQGGRLLGPNVSGFVNAGAGVRLFGLPVPRDLPAGRVGVVLQSGGLATHVLTLARAWGVGLGLLATSGNEALLDATDVLSHLVDDPGTDAIAVFLESVRRPAAFRAAALRAAAAGKPIVALHVGRSALGRAAALSHTGALVGNHDTALAALADVGVVTVDSMEDLLATTALLARHPGGLRGRRVAVVAASGGACELIADAADAHQLTLPPFRPELADRLAQSLPAFAEVRNPLDVTGFVVKAADLPFTATRLVGECAAEDYDVMILQSVVLPAERGPDAEAVGQRFARLADTLRQSPVPTVLQTGATYALSPFALELVTANELTVLPGITAGIKALDAAARLAELRPHALRDRPEPPADDSYCEATDIQALARECGLAFPPSRTVTTALQAVQAAGEIGFPVALKINSPDLPHKSEVSGVALDLASAEAVADAMAVMLRSVTQHRPEARIVGVDVVAMRPSGTELLVSVVQDAGWGRMLTIGAGGVLTEVLEDVVTRPLPLSATDIVAMIRTLRISRLLQGFRGRPAADLNAVAAAIGAVIRLSDRLFPTAVEIEVNPLQVRPDGVEALDLLVALRQEG